MQSIAFRYWVCPCLSTSIAVLQPLERLPRFVMESFLRSKDAQDLINDPAVVQRRTKLQEEIASLQAALTDLKTLPQH